MRKLLNKLLLESIFSGSFVFAIFAFLTIKKMETEIRVKPSELNSTLLDKIKNFIGSKKNIDVTISIKEFDPDYVDSLNQSISQAESGNVISFTMEEFVAYTPKTKQ